MDNLEDANNDYNFIEKVLNLLGIILRMGSLFQEEFSGYTNLTKGQSSRKADEKTRVSPVFGRFTELS